MQGDAGLNIQHPTSNVQRPTSNVQRPTSNVQRPTGAGRKRICRSDGKASALMAGRQTAMLLLQRQTPSNTFKHLQTQGKSRKPGRFGRREGGKAGKIEAFSTPYWEAPCRVFASHKGTKA